MIYFDKNQFYKIIEKRQQNYRGSGIRLSNLQLGKQLGWSQSRIYYVKKHKVPTEAALKIANAVGMSVYEAQSCFKDDGKPMPSQRDGKN